MYVCMINSIYTYISILNIVLLLVLADVILNTEEQNINDLIGQLTISVEFHNLEVCPLMVQMLDLR